MLQIHVEDLLLGILFLVYAIVEFYKGIQMVFWNQDKLLIVAKISLKLLDLLPQRMRQKRYEIVMNAYRRRRKLFGLCALVGGPAFACAGIQMLVSSIIWNR